VPLVEEVAADIFMGTFTRKWQPAAAVASRSLDESLYARYYDLPAPGRWAMPPARQTAEQRERWGKVTAPEFAALCATRAAAEAQAPGAPASRVAVNGTILEQAQILTTHNLATLVDALDLREQMTVAAPELADRAFAWAVRRLARQPDSWHASLLAVKNAAYAWRQAIYYLSLCDQAAHQHTLARLRDRLRANDELQGRFAIAADGLAYAIAAGASTHPATLSLQAREGGSLGGPPDRTGPSARAGHLMGVS
jgi:hypothetical protein